MRTGEDARTTGEDARGTGEDAGRTGEDAGRTPVCPCFSGRTVVHHPICPLLQFCEIFICVHHVYLYLLAGQDVRQFWWRP